MKLKEYQEAAQRTCPSLGNGGIDELHMKLGVYTEIGEIFDIIKKNLAYGKNLDTVHIGEEIADTCWYIVNDARIKEDIFNNNTVTDASFLEPFKDISEVVYRLEEVLRSYVKDNEYSATENLGLLERVSEYFELDFYQLLENNINKLKVRYPEKFTQQAALNRNLEAERIELEK